MNHDKSSCMYIKGYNGSYRGTEHNLYRVKSEQKGHKTFGLDNLK